MGKGIIHTDATKIRCAYLYASSGNYSQVARDTKIKRTSIMTWAKDSTIWDEALIKARQEISDELLAQNLAIATAANNGVLDRIEHGDTKLTKDGPVLVPMGGRDLAVISGIHQDKGRVQMGMATTITKSEGMDQLAETFRKLSRAHKRQQVDIDAIQNTVVSTQEGPIKRPG
jgi:NDP-sugar pyrophosphorylase family protein